MGGFKDSSGGEFGIIFHKKFLSGLVSGWGSAFLRVSAEDVIHNFVFVSSVVTRNVHILPDGTIDISSEWVRIVLKSNGLSEAQKSCHSD